MKHTILTLILLLTSHFSHAQRYNYSRVVKQTAAESLEAIPIDTVPSNKKGMSMVLYSNGTWKYKIDDNHKMDLYSAFNHHWDTTQLFVFKDVAYSDLPPIVELNIIDKLSDFSAPIIGGRVSSKYGPRRSKNHNGTDIASDKGTPLYATFDGKVRYAKYQTGGYGYLVIIRNVNGLESWYGHMCKLFVQANDYVKSGQIIGYVGNTGRSRGNHVHYELRYKDQTFDPEFLIDFETGSLRYTKFSLEKSFFNIHSRASEILDEEDDNYTASSDLFANATDAAAVKEAALTSAGEAPRANVEISESSSAAVYHTVKSGNTLGSIAAKYGTSIDKICKLNGIKRTTVLQLKRRLRVR
ncbi:MAG: peptidoglycan DD-metalloendopeptidase family protein [Rikenellaceae bacterium]